MDDAFQPGFITSSFPAPHNSILSALGVMLVPVAPMVDIMRSCEKPSAHNSTSNLSIPSGHFRVLSQWRSDPHYIRVDETVIMRQNI